MKAQIVDVYHRVDSEGIQRPYEAAEHIICQLYTSPIDLDLNPLGVQFSQAPVPFRIEDGVVDLESPDKLSLIGGRLVEKLICA